MKYWLLKTEPTSYSIHDLERDGRTSWTGIRNFQARNHMRTMEVGDLALFYHSSADPTGVYGIARIVGKAHVDESALDPKDSHYDPKAVEYEKVGKEPLWVAVDIEFVKKLKKPVTLAEIKADKVLKKMLVARKGMRLSVMPVAKTEYKRITTKSYTQFAYQLHNIACTIDTDRDSLIKTK